MMVWELNLGSLDEKEDARKRFARSFSLHDQEKDEWYNP